LDYLLGRPQVTVEATSVNANIAQLYRNAMIRANAGRGASPRAVYAGMEGSGT
jgi:hypothetical protein